MEHIQTALRIVVPTLLASLASAGTEYRITVTGEVEFNGISSGPLSGISVGDDAELSFLVDEDVFVNSGSFPTRGYEIDQASWSLAFPGGSLPLQNPLPGTPYFVLRDNDPAVDGFFVSTNINFPAGVPLAFAGGFGQFVNDFSVTYGGALLPSLDIAGAVGTHDFDGLSVFNWTIDDGPFNPLGLVFEKMTVAEIAPAAVSPYGCGVNPAGSLSVLSGAPLIGDVFELGVDNPLGTQAAGSTPFVIATLAPAVGFPCGISLPGVGMASAAAAGELLLTLGGLNVVFSGGPWTGPGSPASVPIALPYNPGLVGVPVYFQGLLFDPLAALGVDWGLTTAVEGVIGSE